MTQLTCQTITLQFFPVILSSDHSTAGVQGGSLSTGSTSVSCPVLFLVPFLEYLPTPHLLLTSLPEGQLMGYLPLPCKSLWFPKVKTNLHSCVHLIIQKKLYVLCARQRGARCRSARQVAWSLLEGVWCTFIITSPDGAHIKYQW